jgi:DNA processing protein
MATETALPMPTLSPPVTEQDSLAWLRLIRSARVGPATFLRLMAEHGSAAAALAALPGVAAASGVADYAPCPPEAARREWDCGHRAGARALFLGQPAYPPALAALDDPPPFLWALGRAANLGLLARPAVALVGARNASALGLRMARALAGGLGARGLATVSGLARGIDTEVHGASLATGTLAVMAGGVDIVYPPENAALAAAIADQGLRLSEQPMGLEPQARHFPRRNRLIAGLSRAVVVVEAAEGSGSLITARDALDQGRDVLAVPGHPLDPRAAGCNQLIRDGARLVRGVEDVLAALGPDLPAPQPAPRHPTAVRRAAPAAAASPPTAATAAPAFDPVQLHGRILDALGAAPVAEDQLLRDLALPAAAAAPALLFLELAGRIRREPGGFLALA